MMKMKKRSICAGLALTMMLAMGGCGKESETTTSAPAGAASAGTEAKTAATTTEAKSEAKTETKTETKTEAKEPYVKEEPDEYQKYPTDAEYHLVWEENFDQPEARLSDEDWV